MSHTVLYLASPPQEHREVMLSVQPAEFRDVWLESNAPEELDAKLAEAEFLVAGRMTAAMLDKAPKLRMIQMPGVGYEHIDVAACQARGIPVAITPEGTVQGVAEHTVMMMLALYKHLVEAHTALAQGRWIHNQLRHVALMLEDKRVGIVGMGRIGREVARRLQGWGVDLVYTDLRPLPADVELALGARWLELDELLRTSDVVTLHVFLTETSRHMIGEREFGTHAALGDSDQHLARRGRGRGGAVPCPARSSDPGRGYRCLDSGANTARQPDPDARQRPGDPAHGNR